MANFTLNELKIQVQRKSFGDGPDRTVPKAYLLDLICFCMFSVKYMLHCVTLRTTV